MTKDDYPPPAARFVFTSTEGLTNRPACGPKFSDCRQEHLGFQGGVHGWSVYRCPKCGDEEWL